MRWGFPQKGSAVQILVYVILGHQIVVGILVVLLDLLTSENAVCHFHYLLGHHGRGLVDGRAPLAVLNGLKYLGLTVNGNDLDVARLGLRP